MNDRKLYLLFLSQYRDRNWAELSGKQNDIQLNIQPSFLARGFD